MFRDIKTEKPKPTGRRVIAVIGVDRYYQWPRLHNAVSDARGALDAFMRLGFECAAEPLYDEAATADAIRSLAADKLSRLNQNDSLVLFFAGHGHTSIRTFQDGDTTKTGYIVPVDGDRDGGSMARWLRIDSWLSDIARLEVKHILVFLDACHAGIALSSRWMSRGVKRPTESFERLARRRSRRVITSAQDDQRALDGGPISQHSLFTGCLIEGLDGGIAQHGEFVTGSHIGTYLQERVTEYAEAVQTPCFGVFEEDKAGELLIQIVTTTAVQEAAEQARQEAAEKARREAAEKARQEAAERARQEAAEKARREAAEKARREAEQARQEAAEQARQEAAEQARQEAAEKARQEAAEEARREAAETALRKAAERARQEAIEKARREAAEKGRSAALAKVAWAPLDEPLECRFVGTAHESQPSRSQANAATATAAALVAAPANGSSGVSWTPLSSATEPVAGAQHGGSVCTLPVSNTGHPHPGTGTARASAPSVTSTGEPSAFPWIPLDASEAQPAADPRRRGCGNSVTTAAISSAQKAPPSGSRQHTSRRASVAFALLCLSVTASLLIHYEIGASTAAQTVPADQAPAPPATLPPSATPADAVISSLVAPAAEQFAIDVVVEQQGDNDAKSNRVLQEDDDLQSFQKFAIRVRPSRAAFVYTFYCVGLGGAGRFHPLLPSRNPLPAREFAWTPNVSYVVDPEDVPGTRTNVIVAVVASLNKISAMEDSLQLVKAAGETAEAVGTAAHAMTALSSPRRVVRPSWETGLAVCDRPQGIRSDLNPADANVLSVRYQARDNETLIIATLAIGLIDAKDP